MPAGNTKSYLAAFFLASHLVIAFENPLTGFFTSG